MTELVNNTTLAEARLYMCIYNLYNSEIHPREHGDRFVHAYNHFYCMECMACSDNVVRAGLTPKYIDKHTLVEMLDYTGRPVNRTKFLGIEDNQEISTTIFRPPVPDFGVTKFQVDRVAVWYQWNLGGFVYKCDGGSLCVCEC